MLTGDIIVGGVNLKNILNTIIAFVLKIVGKEFPEVGEIL